MSQPSNRPSYPARGSLPWDLTLKAYIDSGDVLAAGTAQDTADTFEPYKIIFLSDGTVRAIPQSAVPPATPTGVVVTPRLSSVQVSWTAVPGATRYVLYRTPGGVISDQILSNGFRDLNITVGSTYQYQVQAVDQYGQRSAKSATVSGFVNPAQNVPPDVTVKSHPAILPSVGRAILRVNGSDVNAQELAYMLEVSEGSITPTDDISKWIYEGV